MRLNGWGKLRQAASSALSVSELHLAKMDSQLSLLHVMTAAQRSPGCNADFVIPLEVHDLSSTASSMHSFACARPDQRIQMPLSTGFSSFATDIPHCCGT